MAKDWSVEVKAEGPLLEGGRAAEAIIFAETERAFEDIAGIIEREVVREAPQGGTGALRGSIVSGVRGRTLDALRGSVAVTADHAAAVEFGRRPGTMPPWGVGSSLFSWVRRKLGVGGAETARVSFLIARSIARRGTKGSGFFTRALEQGRSAVEARIRQLGADIAEKLGG